MRKRRKSMDRINVVDVEATCWWDSSSHPPNEIIQIGIVMVDLLELKVEREQCLYVKPKMGEISAFCNKLTGITQEDVDTKGMSLKDACGVLRTCFFTEDYAWGSYGDYDKGQFERECRDKGVAYPFGRRHLNIKSLLAMSLGWPDEVGMDVALDEFDMKLVGRHHDGLDDARNIATLLIALFKKVRG